MPADPLASLAPSPVEVEITGHEFVIPAAPAAVWLRIFLDDRPNVDMILPGMAGRECRTVIYRGLMNRTFTVKEWQDMICEVIEVVSGRRWWQAMNFINGMKDPDNWQSIFGHLTLRGVDVNTVSLAAWLDAAYALVTESMSKEDRIKFELAIDTVPDGVSPEEAIDEAAQQRAFMAMMKAVQAS